MKIPCLLLAALFCFAVQYATFANTPADSDGDGVNDFREGKDGTDPNNAASFNPLSKGLVAYYPFNENFEDESGNQNHFGNKTPGVTIVDGRLGVGSKSVKLSSNGESAVSVKNLGITGNQNHAIALWVYLQETPVWDGKYNGSLVTIGSPFGNQIGRESRIFVDNSNEPSGSRLLAHGGYSDLEKKGLANSFFGQWKHVVFSYNGIISKSSLYLDGAKIDASIWGGLDNLRSMLDGPVYLGSTPLSEGNASGSVSQLDDIRIYNRALSAAEVSQLYAKESENPNMVTVRGGTLPQGSGLAGQVVGDFQIGKFEVTWGEWKAVREWAVANGYTDLEQFK